jgi:hypothetical protein
MGSTNNSYRNKQEGIINKASLDRLETNTGIIGSHLHNSEHVYGNNTWMTEDYPVKFTVTGGDNAWGTELMLYCGDTIESGSTVKKVDLNTFYIMSVSAANKISVVELLYGTAGPAITPIVTDDSDDDFELADHGLAVGDKVIINTVTTTTGVNAYTVYYVLAGSNANHFQLSLTSGGSAVVLGGGDGTCSISKLTQTNLTKFFVSKSATAVSLDPYKLVCPRIACNQRIFIRAKSETGSTIGIGFLLGLHLYNS